MQIRRPEPVRLELSNGTWISVKKHLNAGEQRRVFAKIILKMEAGKTVELDPEQAGLSICVEYLLDWNVMDADGKPLVVRDQPASVKQAALQLLEPEDFEEIRDAIQKHDELMKLERMMEKKVPAGASTS